jgi:cytochrome c-type biogenesis protein
LTIAFVAGLLSFLSPCVLPLIPSYVSFLTGMSVDDAAVQRRTALAHAGFFVLGFSLIFLTLGATATALGRLFQYYQEWIARVGGVIIALLGLYLLGVFRLGFLAREARVQFRNKPVGFLGSVVVGAAFGAGWTPCIGPILAGILGLAATRDSVAEGMWLLGAYSAGLAVPFLPAAAAVDRFLAWFKRFRGYIVWVERIAGALLVVLGLLLATGYFTILSAWLQSLTPEFLKSRL